VEGGGTGKSEAASSATSSKGGRRPGAAAAVAAAEASDGERTADRERKISQGSRLWRVALPCPSNDRMAVGSSSCTVVSVRHGAVRGRGVWTTRGRSSADSLCLVKNLNVPP